VVLVHIAVVVQIQVEDRHNLVMAQVVSLVDLKVQEVGVESSLIVVVVSLAVVANSHSHSSSPMMAEEPLVSEVGRVVMEVAELLVVRCVLLLVLRACAQLRHHVVHPCRPSYMRIVRKSPCSIDIVHACLRSQSQML